MLDSELRSISNINEVINDRIDIVHNNGRTQRNSIPSINITNNKQSITMDHSWIRSFASGVVWNLILEAKVLSSGDSIKFLSLVNTYYDQRIKTWDEIGRYSVYFDFRMTLLLLDTSLNVGINYRSICFFIFPKENNKIKKIEIEPLGKDIPKNNYLDKKELPSHVNRFNQNQYCFIVNFVAIRGATDSDKGDSQYLKFNIITYYIEAGQRLQSGHNSKVLIRKVLFLNQPSYSTWNDELLNYQYNTYVYKVDRSLGINKTCKNPDKNKRCRRGNMVCKEDKKIGPNCNETKNIHPISPSPCTENGTWTESNLTNNSYSTKYCKCKPGYFGKLCQYKYSCLHCEPNKCISNNNCSLCRTHWENPNCSVLKLQNLENICGTGNISISNKKIECKCNMHFYGRHCEISVRNFCGFQNHSIFNGNLICEKIIHTPEINYLYFLPSLILLLIVIFLIFLISCRKKIRIKKIRPGLNIVLNEQDIISIFGELQEDVKNNSECTHNDGNERENCLKNEYFISNEINIYEDCSFILIDNTLSKK